MYLAFIYGGLDHIIFSLTDTDVNTAQMENVAKPFQNTHNSLMIRYDYFYFSGKETERKMIK